LQSLISARTDGRLPHASVDGVRFQPRAMAHLPRVRSEDRSVFGWSRARGEFASRLGLLMGIAFYVLTAAYGVVAGGHWDEVRDTALDVSNRVAVTAGFEVKSVRVEGRQLVTEARIRELLGPYDGQSIFAFDTDAARARLKSEGWIGEARVMRLLPSTLILELEERKPFALWREGGRTAVIDPKGRVLGFAARGEFSDLPVVSGAGAAAPAKEIIEAVSALPELKSHVQEIQRVAGRRWDLVLDSGLRAKLPGTAFVDALTDIGAIVGKSPAAFYEISEMDFRVPTQFTVRLKDDTENGRERFLSWLTAEQAISAQGL
jgi:cell division protein FtsQ